MMITNDEIAASKIMKARNELIQVRRFYGVLVSNVEPVPSRQHKTMATNSKQHFYNPDWIIKLPQEQVLAVQVHESEHDARHHSTRRGGRDPEKWNEACDYAINIDLKEEGFALPECALIDARFKGMAAEDIYRIRELEEEAGGGRPASGAGAADEGPRDPKIVPGDHPAHGGSRDPGGMGAVIDAPPEEAAEIAAHWDRAVRQAVAMSRGLAPGHIIRDIERARLPKQDWREVLRAWLDAGAQRRETWNRPNRRFAGRLILPGSQKYGLNHVAMLVDTSKSMDKKALQCVADEMQRALDAGVIDKITAIYGDTRVTRVDEFADGDTITFDPCGGGGTRLQPLFDHANELDATLILCFTDGFFGALGASAAPAAQVLFCFTGRPDVVRQHIAKAPWDSPGIDVGEH